LSFRPDDDGGQAMRTESNEEAIERKPTDAVYLERLLAVDGIDRLQQTLAGWANDALHRGELKHDPVWNESVAVGNSEFSAACRRTAGALRHLEVDGQDGHCSLRENALPYRVNIARKIKH